MESKIVKELNPSFETFAAFFSKGLEDADDK